MLWFKHYTNMHKSKYLQRIMEEFGKVEGYGLFCLFLSYFADKYDGSDNVSFKVRLKELQSFMEVSRQKLVKFLQIPTNSDQIPTKSHEIPTESEKLTIKIIGNFVEIEWPNLLKIRDEYSRKSGQTPDSNPDNVAQEKEKEKEKEHNNKGDGKFSDLGWTFDVLRDPSLDPILQTISAKAQKTWLSRYKDSVWIKNNLLECVAYYQAKGDEHNWGLKLTTWLSRAKARGGPQKPLYDPLTDQPEDL